MEVAMCESCHPPPKEGLPTEVVALAKKDVPKEAVVPPKHFEKLPCAIQDKLSLLGIDLETMQSTLIGSRKN
eukprot:1600861-Ditylum_brightwellii.AAC.1